MATEQNKVRGAIVFAAWLLGGCAVNEAELKAIQAQLEERVAQLEKTAQRLKGYQLELGRLEKHLVELGAGLPPVSLHERRPSPSTAVPPVSPLEDSDAARLRAQIAQTERRLTELNSLVGDLDYLDQRRKQLEERLGRLEDRSTGSNPVR